MSERDDNFDFEEWMRTGHMRSLYECAHAAVRSLALDDREYRGRLLSGLFCMLLADEELIPSHLRPAYEKLANYVLDRVGERRADHRDLANLVKRMKYK